MSHNDLINEVIRQLTSRFTPSPPNIKKRIEGLIDVSLVILVWRYTSSIDSSYDRTERVFGTE